MNETLNRYEDLVKIKTSLTSEDLSIYKDLLNSGLATNTEKDCKRIFWARVNTKFDFNKSRIQEFLNFSHTIGLHYNFREKNTITEAFNYNTSEELISLLSQKDSSKITSLMSKFQPISPEETMRLLKIEYKTPSGLRTNGNLTAIRKNISLSLLSAYIWSYFSERDLYQYFTSKYTLINYEDDYSLFLKKYLPDKFKSKKSLIINHLKKDSLDSSEPNQYLFSLLKDIYNDLENYGHSIFVVEIQDGKVWDIVSKLIFIAENFIQTDHTKLGFYKWLKIYTETNENLLNKKEKLSEKDFRIIDEGFTYKDTFILTNKKNHIKSVCVLFQKNQRDETPIPCPSCLSINVRSNSYSNLGVRSWECNNQICPARTKYNRGKRYSLKSLQMQKAIEDISSQIEKTTIKRWRRDIVEIDEKNVLTDLIKLYSIKGAKIEIRNSPTIKKLPLDRKITYIEDAQDVNSQKSYDISFNRKSLIEKVKPADKPLHSFSDGRFNLICGDSYDVLQQLGSNSVDAAITSPPYYNAREYSKWPNIFCYLYDMFNITRQVSRVLKPGSLYLYNIFDYFDNKNIITKSLMGKTRIPLSAYTAEFFERAGFQLIGNLVWDKGEIQGKRGFNNGNNTPYYQNPFNCWEHILIFKKPGETKEYESSVTELASTLLKVPPVFKIIKGENIYGHSAPFPEQLPEILIKYMKKGDVILDPFAGSSTTGRVASKYEINSINIEKDPEYYRLGINLYNKSKEKNLQLFHTDQPD